MLEEALRLQKKAQADTLKKKEGGLTQYLDERINDVGSGHSSETRETALDEDLPDAKRTKLG